MQTIYHKTSNFIQHTGNFIDLTEFRRRQALAQQDSLARQAQEEQYNLESSAFCPVVLTLSAEERRRARWERWAWRLDVCACLAVLLFTVAFTLRILL